MIKMLCESEEKFIPIKFYDDKNVPMYLKMYCGFMSIFLNSPIYSDVFSTDKEKTMGNQYLDQIAEMSKNKQIPILSNLISDPVEASFETELTPVEIKNNIETMTKASLFFDTIFKQIYARGLKKSFSEATYSNPELLFCTNLSSLIYFHADKNNYPNSDSFYFQKSYLKYQSKENEPATILKVFSEFPFLPASKKNAQLILKNKVNFKEAETSLENYETKTYAVCREDGTGYLNSKGGYSPLTKAKLFSNKFDADRTAKYRSAVVVELDLIFSDIPLREFRAKDNLLAMKNMAERDKIKKEFTSEQLAVTQLEHAILTQYLKDNGFNLSDILHEALSKIPENIVSTKDKVEHFKKGLTVKPKIKTL